MASKKEIWVTVLRLLQLYRPLKDTTEKLDNEETFRGAIGPLKPVHWNPADVEPAVVPVSSGKEVIIAANGLYLVYSSILFFDHKMKQALGIARNNQRLFVCFEGLDYIDFELPRSRNTKYKTCSVSGIAYLSKGDNLTMISLYENTNMDIREEHTFLGLIQLAPSRETIHLNVSQRIEI